METTEMSKLNFEGFNKSLKKFHSEILYKLLLMQFNNYITIHTNKNKALQPLVSRHEVI